MYEAIKNTLNRLTTKIHLPGFTQFRELMSGFAVEFGRVVDYRDKVKRSIVPNPDMDPDTIDDYKIKYGESNYLGGTTEDQINRIIEKAALTGNGGPDWIQEQVQQAGFPLYMIENADRSIDPATVQGSLIVCSPPRGEGKETIQFDDYGIQFDDPVQYDSPNPKTTYPVPVKYEIGSDPKYWGYYFFLSPFPDRLATQSELLLLTGRDYIYLKNLIIELKHLRFRCIAQVGIDMRIVTDTGMQIVTDTGMKIIAVNKGE